MTKQTLPSIEKFHYGRSAAYSFYEFGFYRIYDETASRVPGYRITYAGEYLGFHNFYTDAVELCERHASR